MTPFHDVELLIAILVKILGHSGGASPQQPSHGQGHSFLYPYIGENTTSGQKSVGPRYLHMEMCWQPNISPEVHNISTAHP
jgi:hypothetical protein